jgi:hypothetical protein
LEKTRRHVERGWHATSEALRSQGQTALADQTQSFVGGLPPVRTEREWFIAGLLEQAGRHRAREIDLTR